MWFAVGIAVALGMSLALGKLVEPLHIGLLNLAVIPVGAIVGGTIAGWSLHRGARGVVGFAVSYLIGFPLLFLSWIGIQGLGGGMVILMPALMAAVSFAILGALGAAIAGLGENEVGRAAIEFGVAGLVGGLVLAVLLLSSFPGARTVNLVLLVLGSVAFLVLPAAVGGIRLKRRLVGQVSASPDASAV